MPALAVGDRRWSVDAAAAAVRRTALQLSAQGLAPGDVVLRAADDPLHLVLLQHALVEVGAGLLPHPPGLTAAERHALCAAVGAEWRWRRGGLARTGCRREAGPLADRTAPALLIRTSGSGGMPKVVMLTAPQLAASAARVNAALDLGAGDEWLCVLPLHHIGGLAIGWRCAAAGATLRLLGNAAAPALPVDDAHAGDGQAALDPSDISADLSDGGGVAAVQGGFQAEAVAAALARHPVTHLSLVPTMLARLLEVMPAPPPRLRVLLLGGQALHPALARRALRAGWPLHVSYGMSETGSMVAVGPWRDGAGPGARVGPPLPDVMLDCAGPAEPPRPLRLHGPMLMAGYADAARRPGRGLADGWLTTGDLCRLDADGALRVLGRADELVVIGGEQVSPSAVEAKLAAAPGVREVAVVAVAHPHWGATLAACWSGPAAPAVLDAWCRDRLPSRQRPRIFRRLDALPLLASGKPDRAALTRLAAASDAATPNRPGTQCVDAKGKDAHEYGDKYGDGNHI
ncbi:class I adenylate-forming enzyme family protein [uncultured Thiohalocapsa sp.]|uniref:class I adenylate-forming enzyme family protein n=1 Tax=uncultured Thiohalocapsa sp. TaxID=768990 RepID=UPI0025F9B305|nr:AMP-binding protein [uncultured Thiohalocapsa sp.]